MADIPASQVETAGVYGHAGPIPTGTQATSGSVKDTAEIGAGGSKTARPELPGEAGTKDTSGTYGPNKPSSHVPVSTLLAGVTDTTLGYAADMTARTYRAPGAPVPGTIYETNRATGFAGPIPTETVSWSEGVTETANFGAPGGKITTQVDTITADVGVPVPLTKVGILSSAAQLVVRKGETVLVSTTDYTVNAAGSRETRTYSIVAVDSATVNDNDELTVTYLVGDRLYFNTHLPSAVPTVPTIGTAVALDRAVRVVWTNPAQAITDDIDGYVIQSDTGGTRYVPGGVLNFRFEQVVPGQPYKFRVAAFNEKGVSAFSNWSNAVTPLSYDQVPPAGLAPANVVNPIYRADGTIKAGTGLGPQ